MYIKTICYLSISRRDGEKIYFSDIGRAGGGWREDKGRPPSALTRVWTTVGKLVKVALKKLI